MHATDGLREILSPSKSLNSGQNISIYQIVVEIPLVGVSTKNRRIACSKTRFPVRIAPKIRFVSELLLQIRHDFAPRYPAEIADSQRRCPCLWATRLV
jgi:hypothetical protein